MCTALPAVLLALLGPLLPARAQAPLRTPLVTHTDQALAGAIDVSSLPSSQLLSLILTLRSSEAQSAALAQLLADQVTSSSPRFHQWLTPQQVAAQFGASSDQMSHVISWAESYGLSVDSVSPSSLRISVSGSASQVERAFAVTLHQYQRKGGLVFANVAPPSLPVDTALEISAIDGLDNLSADALSATYANAQHVPVSSGLDFASLAGLIDANATAVLHLSSSLCTSVVSPSQLAEYRLLLEQANVQGVTVLADQGCATGAFPAALAEVTAITSPASSGDVSAPIVSRPAWQAAVGLPSDGMRATPDLVTSSTADLVRMLNGLVIQTGERLGNVNHTLYALAPEAGLYTQPDAAPDGTWEPATGLGLVNLTALARAWPRGVGASTMTLASSASSLVQGQTFTLTATEAVASGGGSIPTGAIFFTSPQPGFTASSVVLNASGAATSPAWLLPAATYLITATYSGDGTYGATSATATVTVQSVPAGATTTTLSISPTNPLSGVPATLTATVAPTAVSAAVPAGTVSFYKGSTLLGTGTLATVGSSAVATLTTTLTGSSAQTLTAVYSGNTSFAASTSPALSVIPATAASGVTLTSNVATTLSGYSVTLTASVSGATAAGVTPTGNVSFYVAGASPRLLGVSAVGAAGAGLSIAVLATPNIPDGAQTIYAVYAGDANFSPVISNNLSIGVSDYNVTFVPQSLTVARGQSGQMTLVLGAINGFPGTVAFGCTPPPNTEITCSFSPATLTGGGTSTMTLQTTAPKTSSLRAPSTSFRAVEGVVLASLLGFFLPSRRRRVPLRLLLLLALALTMNLGCAANDFAQTGPITDAGTPLGTASMVVNTAGTDGVNTVRHNYTFQVTVQ